jgi:hypothetical protein
MVTQTPRPETVTFHRRPALGVPLLATALGLALCLDQARLGYLARDAEVARLLVAPPLWLWVLLALAMIGAGGVGVYGARVRRDARLARVPLLAVVIVAFVEIFVTAPARPVSTRLEAVRAFGEAVREYQQQSGALPATQGELEALVTGDATGRPFPSPTLLVRGVPVERWTPRLLTGCTGPQLERGNTPAGTFLYCLQDGGGSAWITAVGRTSSTFGPPELLQLEGKPLIETVVVDPPSPELAPPP